VIDENSGVIVMGSDVRISTIAIAQGNLTIKVTETRRSASLRPSPTPALPRSCPAPTSRSMTARATRSHHARRRVAAASGRCLNALGVGPRDIISILQAIKAAGALQADIEIIG